MFPCVGYRGFFLFEAKAPAIYVYGNNLHLANSPAVCSYEFPVKKAPRKKNTHSPPRINKQKARVA